MLTYEEALAQILGQVVPLPPVQVPLAEALGLVLAEDLIAPHDLPPFDNSSMDGFAVRAIDIAEAQAVLRVQGDIAAGALSVPSLIPGMVLRIMTGAPVPEGADTVVPVEDTAIREDGIAFLEDAEFGQNIRRAGEEVKTGTVVVSSGSLLRPAAIGMAATVGHAEVRAHPKPRVAILSTGDELVEPPTPLRRGQIYNSNAYALAAQVEEAGGIVTQRLHARDTPDALRAAFDACAGADILITSGGVSVGDFDYVKAVFAERGTVDFWRVAVRPGKPLAFGQWGKTLFFGLPGNPVSSMVTFELFVRPALRKMAGHSELTRPLVSARLTEDTEHTPGRRSYQRAIVSRPPGEYSVRTTGAQGSGRLGSMVLANALLVLPAETAVFPSGTRVLVLLLD
ncbi:MAG: molybdopterin molybdotransferase MoeA [Janthinobacterium lividum]